ncbi:MAG: hypothetical protein LBD88_02370 [Candidatus Peribacteria bacterium]|nr:hypothetical protein [Candidatus Peribacteria bacterium]
MDRKAEEERLNQEQERKRLEEEEKLQELKTKFEEIQKVAISKAEKEIESIK